MIPIYISLRFFDWFTKGKIKEGGIDEKQIEMG